MGHDDALFDYDAGLESTLQDIAVDSNRGGPIAAPVLGLDEKVTITKQRRSTVKLDEGRLLSQAGIPKLRSTAKSKLKFKGKGHEFSDAARLLNFYQLWLDDLFPRAKFADGLAIIEKLGHSKRLQTMRREWIDEEKPRIPATDFEDAQQTGFSAPHVHDNSMSIRHLDEADAILGQGDNVAQSPPRHGIGAQPSSLTLGDAPQQGDLFVSDNESVPREITEGTHDNDDDDDDDDDELEALLREHEDSIIDNHNLAGPDAWA
ncbi:chromosome segregation in meiosis protein 3 [Aspergillus eucalypticola CBS 122712]|uniref:Chromosome segregation in meiosis protein n=1 Tax=Aspergillus eucalypticola (strain CBS 122712 / IBT 29274) TaxID=1448314 RepID=A0A317VWN5_ASPEC|nr:chromosome segregation in meiosis protein 3 [Aspergillus eucalypticola CBS 122712]PWY77999.1 chromosome segregation in meiosis protein 3 [Aspergillus eucalypticola CBS 122712]